MASTLWAERSASIGGTALPAGFVVMWSSGFIGGRLGTATASTATLMIWRFALVAAGLALLAGLLGRLRRPRRTLSRREVAAQAVVGLFGQGLYIWGSVGAIEVGVGAGTAALIAALQPIMASALAGPVLGEPVSPRQWAGLGLGLLGVVLVVGADLTSADAAPWWAYGLPFLGMAALVAATLVERRTSAAATPLVEALGIQTAASAVLFAVLAMATGQLAPPTVELGAFSLAVAWFIGLSTLGAYGFYWLTLRRTGVTHLSSLIYLTPPTTMLWAWLMFGDPVTLRALIGLAVCAAAVTLVHSRRPTRKRPPPQSTPPSPPHGYGHCDAGAGGRRRIERGVLLDDRSGRCPAVPVGDGECGVVGVRDRVRTSPVDDLNSPRLR